ncbi:hypothetical protein PFICI_08171 [Pestalotiopsis fici W106-1]|uniref:Uncharacterized protein n=1 Tax=Pestalotiopsis fici (strain W106-1 / CGMCC3.15140) TaxID=1229662 RepID=W3X5F1_PESFW|nr:uncharacterized protein PFICI_08171 [Pestalotiopsis fici W106-1]ETS80642.1 hypothetical protein PFICI_08171 [Pestalotiopsis fici W106-1]
MARTRVASRRAAAARVSKEPSPAPQDTDSKDTDVAAEREDDGKRVSRRISARTASRTSIATTTKTTITSNPRQSAALDAARMERDAAMLRLEDITTTSTTGGDSAGLDGEDTESSLEVEMGRRAVAATPAHGRASAAARLHDVSGLDLDDSMFDDINTTIDTLGPASASRSLDTSTFSASQFRRRPRAGSFMSRDDGPVRPSSRAGPNTPGISSTFNIGVFKRRAREPSILGTAQKPRAERPMPQSDLGNETDNNYDENDNDEEALEELELSPEHESTPLRRSKRRSGAATSGDAEPSSNIKSRKRKSTEAHEQRQRSPPFPQDDSNMVDESDDEPLSSPPSLPPVRRASTPLMDENIAPPESSGSEDEAEVWPPLQSLARGRSRRAPSAQRRTPVRDLGQGDNESDMSSPPSLTYSPNYADPSPPPKSKQTRAASKPISTADLTGLLPRRRQRSARNDPLGGDDSDEEVDAAGLGNDDDELSYLDVRRTRRRPAKPLARAGTSNQTTTARAQKKDKVASKPARTYGRLSDKENQEDGEGEGDSANAAPDDDDVFEQEDSGPGEELKNAAKKFAEVDKWELEFEERMQSSSPRDAR